MNIIRKTCLLFIFFLYFFISCNGNNKQNDQNGNELLINSIIGILNKHHFISKNINQNFFDGVTTRYFEILDNKKNLFTGKEFQKIKALNQFNQNGNFANIKIIYRNLEEISEIRAKKFKKTLTDYLSQPLDYTLNQSYNISHKKKQWPQTEAELITRWKLMLKNNLVTELVFELDANPKITINSKEFKEKEVTARKKLTKSVKKIFNELITQKPLDYFHYYLNAITSNYDKHTIYFPPVEQETFNLSLTGKLEGIGAQITKSDDGYIEIANIIPGGPSFKQKKLQSGDKILKVGQDDDQELVDVSTLTLNEGLSLIRGKKGTKVRLLIRKVSGEEKEIFIIRDVVILQETYTRSVLFKNKESNYGYIFLPSFYRDFKNGIARNSSQDVKNEIKHLMKKNIQGLVFDLRNNGGGALQDAIKISGLFIKNGPIVRVKSSQQEHAPLYDRDNDILFNLPLVFLINENSASASEIVCAAMQDYNRAIIMGTHKSFGKGTVQTSFDLNQININQHFDRNFGGIKLTIQKFYRVTGKSTQNIGVTPDIIFPNLSETLDPIETDFPYDFLDTLEFKKWNNPHSKQYQKIIKQTQADINQKNYFKKIKEKINLILKNKKKNLTLNLKKRLQERKEFNKKLNQLNEKITKPFTNFKIDIDQEKKDVYGQEWYNDLGKDIQVNEAMKVLKRLKNIKS